MEPALGLQAEQLRHLHRVTVKPLKHRRASQHFKFKARFTTSCLLIVIVLKPGLNMLLYKMATVVIMNFFKKK